MGLQKIRHDLVTELQIRYRIKAEPTSVIPQSAKHTYIHQPLPSSLMLYQINLQVNLQVGELGFSWHNQCFVIFLSERNSFMPKEFLFTFFMLCPDKIFFNLYYTLLKLDKMLLSKFSHLSFALVLLVSECSSS